MNYRYSTYAPPGFHYDGVSDYSFFWNLDGGSRNPNNLVLYVKLYLLQPPLELDHVYEPERDNSTVVALEVNGNDLSGFGWNYSFTKGDDDGAVAYSLNLFAQDSLRQPHHIKMDISKKLMAVKGVTGNFNNFLSQPILSL